MQHNKTGIHTPPPLLIKGAFIILFVLALALRIFLLPIQTSDYTNFLSQWYNFIQQHGGFAALRYSFSNYNVPYLYLLAITTYLPIPQLVAIKTLSILFDIPMGIFTYLILRLQYPRGILAWCGTLAIAFAPTLFINSAAWGQADAMYAVFCLGSLYFLLTKRPGWACAFCGLAIAFKLQAIFFFPILLMLLLKKKLAIPYLLLIPTVFLLLLLPAFLAGRSAESLLTIYVNQVASGGVGSGTAGTGTGLPTQGAGRSNTFPGSQPDANNRTTQPGNTRTGNNPGSGPTGPGNASSGPGQTGGTSFNNTLTLNAPSFYQWLPANAPTGWKWLGIALAGLLILLIAILLLASKQALTATILLKTTLVFAIGIPFLLPEMHERYFYLADVLSIVAAFSFPRTCFVAIVVQLCSLLSYAPYFLNQQIISLAYVAGAELAMLLVVLFDLLLALFPAWQHKLRELMSDDEASSASSHAG